MAKIHLVSCVRQKDSRAREARDLYLSDWFFKARAYVESHRFRWFILSAKHGVMDPSAVTEPYDMTLNTMRVHLRREWAARVAEQLGAILQPGDTVAILAGARYREFITGHLSRMGYAVEVPMNGMRIGEQLRWLKMNIRQG